VKVFVPVGSVLYVWLPDAMGVSVPVWFGKLDGCPVILISIMKIIKQKNATREKVKIIFLKIFAFNLKFIVRCIIKVPLY